MAGRFESVAQRPLCRLADLFNPFEDVFALPFVNRHPEGLPAVRGLDDRNRQIAADVCLRFWFLRRFQDLEKLLGVGGRLEARKKQVYVSFICEEHLARVLILQSGFKGMEASSLDLERIRHELVLVHGHRASPGSVNSTKMPFWTATLTTCRFQSSPPEQAMRDPYFWTAISSPKTIAASF